MEVLRRDLEDKRPTESRTDLATVRSAHILGFEVGTFFLRTLRGALGVGATQVCMKPNAAWKYSYLAMIGRSAKHLSLKG